MHIYNTNILCKGLYIKHTYVHATVMDEYEAMCRSFYLQFFCILHLHIRPSEWPNIQTYHCNFNYFSDYAYLFIYIYHITRLNPFWVFLNNLYVTNQFLNIKYISIFSEKYKQVFLFSMIISRIIVKFTVADYYFKYVKVCYFFHATFV